MLNMTKYNLLIMNELLFLYPLLNLTIEIFSIVSVSLLVSYNFTPIQKLKEILGLTYPERVWSKNWLLNQIIKNLRYLLNCPMCLSFWISLLYFGHIQTALFVYFITLVIEKKINNIQL